MSCDTGTTVSKCSCNSNWQNILKTDQNGNELSGSKAALAQAILHGSKVRIHFNNTFANVQNAIVLKNEVACVQSLFHVSKKSWNKHRADAYWCFLNVCTSGNVHISRWFVGTHLQPSESKERSEIQWFVRNLDCDSKPSTPLFCNTENGWIMCGTLLALKTAIGNGAEIHVVDAMSNYAAESTNIEFNKTIVSTQHVWHVSQHNFDGHEEFQNKAYWWFTMLSSDGFRDMSRWYVGEHRDRSHTNDTIPMKWFADTCWKLVYEHDKDGKAIYGSLVLLIKYVLTGRRVRLLYDNNYAIEADNLIVWNRQSVTAQVLGNVSKASMKTFKSDAYWDWQNLATTGRIDTIRISVGSNAILRKFNGRQKVKWFVDTRPWRHVFSNSKNGTPSSGSKSELIKNVKAGKLLRFAVNGDDKFTNIVNADNTQLSPDNTQLGAQHIRSVSIQKNGQNISFQSNPYWVFMIATTEGNIDRSRWTVGLHESRGQTNNKAPIDWFVS